MKFLVTVFVCLSTCWALPLNNDKISYSVQDTRIIGGYSARAGQFPYAAAIKVQTPNSSIFCGGALLSPLWVITSGRCLKNATVFEISFGTTSVDEEEISTVMVTATTYFIHPEFDYFSLENDIGLIQLREDILFSDYIGKINLPVNEYGADLNVTSIGWGQINDYEPGPVEHLNYVGLLTLANEACQKFYSSSISDNMICVAGSDNEGICIGDSGGPLIYLLNGRHPIIVGVASFYSSEGCESPYPSGFTRAFPNRDWILGITGSLS